MVLNRKLAWEVLHAFCLMEMSHLVEVTYFIWKCHVSRNTMSCGNAMREKYFHKGTQEITYKHHTVACMDMGAKMKL